MTTRPITAANATRWGEQSTGLLTFVAIQDAAGTGVYRYHDGIGDYAFGGNTYTGMGEYLTFSPITETTAVAPVGVQVTLSGLDASHLTDAFNRKLFGRTVAIHIGAIGEDLQLEADPELWVKAFVDRVTVALGDNQAVPSATVTLHCETLLASINREISERATSENQSLIDASDTFFDFLPELDAKDILWGGERVDAGIRGTGAGRPRTPVRPD